MAVFAGIAGIVGSQMPELVIGRFVAIKALNTCLDMGSLGQVGREGVFTPDITCAASAVHRSGMADAGPAATIATGGVRFAKGVGTLIGHRFEVTVIAGGVAHIAGTLHGPVHRLGVGYRGVLADVLFILAGPDTTVLRAGLFFRPVTESTLIFGQPLG